jgi:amidophosphoribosyltransferase
MCGVFGIHGDPEAANLVYLGLHALQHRGQEAAGIVTSDGERLYAHKGSGLVQAVFTPRDLATLPGTSGIGHVRYSTAGGSHLKNAQPLAVDYARGSIAVAHNGNLTNHDQLRERLEARGSIFQTASDTEAIVHLVAVSTQRAVEDRIADALGQVEGAYSLVCLTEDKLIAVRDPYGLRPLCLGTLRRSDALSMGGAPADEGEGQAPPPRPSGDGVAWVVASEPASFELIGAQYVRDIEPGEMVIFAKGGLTSRHPFPPQQRKMCLFEYVYFARPDSRLESASVYEVRKALGRRLAEEHPIPPATGAAGRLSPGDGDAVVIPVPDSGVPAAVGFAARTGIPFEMGLIRSHYVGRTFIEPQQSIRHFGVRLKLAPNRAAIAGKRVIVVDDSIVRGTTSRKIVKMVRDAGAAEVHVRISSPPTAWPCYYGIDTPTRSELIASSHTVEEIGRYLTADSIGYLSLEGLVESVRSVEQQAKNTPVPSTGYCHACFSGNYPVALAPRVTGNKQLRLVHG